MKESTPRTVARSIICLMAGIKASHPSTPNRFSDGYFLAMKSSNLTKSDCGSNLNEHEDVFMRNYE
uniref:Uncharacterized protein n=1 Tax=Romanomermis culicivorax TaxID=13658 RepID=A0A915K9K1_ROMCU